MPAFKRRTLEKTIRKALRSFPAIVITGPRQSGKTSLLKHLFAKTHRFVSLENPDVRMRAKDDPSGFLASYHPPVIIDEIQYAPDLLPYIKSMIDERRKPGQWLLTGSQNFALMHGISQSLAGRAAILSLLPFSCAERINSGNRAKDMKQWTKQPASEIVTNNKMNISEMILRGNYPEIASRRQVDRQLWCGSYITTYLERDVRNILQVGNLDQFERFLKLCATRTGSILNLSDLAKDIGISVPTARRWLSLLESSYQIYLLYPYYKNIGKRIIKSPKLYWSDTALATYLLGIHDTETLLNSPNFGHLFETFIVTDFLKRFAHFGQMPAMYYLRTPDGLEIDLVLEESGKLHFIEIKSSATITAGQAASLCRAIADLKEKPASAAIISMADNNFIVKTPVVNYYWKTVVVK
jgi:predicted AAA+ superfamily ATPase